MIEGLPHGNKHLIDYGGFAVLLFFSAFGLGIAFFAPPGTITAQLLRGMGQHGFLWTLFLQTSALIGLILWTVIAFVGAAIFAQTTLARAILDALGGRYCCC